MTPLTDSQETAEVLRQYNGEPAYKHMEAKVKARVVECNTPQPASVGGGEADTAGVWASLTVEEREALMGFAAGGTIKWSISERFREIGVMAAVDIADNGLTYLGGEVVSIGLKGATFLPYEDDDDGIPSVVPEFLANMTQEQRQKFADHFNQRDAKTVVLDQMTKGYADAKEEIERLKKQLAHAEAKFEYIPYPVRIENGDNEHPANYSIVRMRDDLTSRATNFIEAKEVIRLAAENATLRAKEGIPPLNDVLEITRFISGLHSYINNLEMIIYTSVTMTDIMREAIPNGEKIYNDINKRWGSE